MKTVSQLAIVIAAFLVPALVQADLKEVGNGGDAIVCRDSSGNIRSAELLDYYEGRANFGWGIQLPNSSLSDALQILNTRLEKRNYLMVEEYEARQAKFAEETNFLSGTELVDIPDSEHTNFPKGCKVEQLAIQKDALKMLPGEKRYIVNKDIWDRLDAANQAGLVMHEVLYRETLGKNSRYVRYLNALLATDEYQKQKIEDLYRTFSKLRVKMAYREGQSTFSEFQVDGDGFLSSQKVESAGDTFNGVKIRGVFKLNSYRGVISSIEGEKAIGGSAELLVAGQPIKFVLDSKSLLIQFFPNGQLHRLDGTPEVQSVVYLRSVVSPEPLPCGLFPDSTQAKDEENRATGEESFFKNVITFFPDGEVKYCGLVTKKTQTYQSSRARGVLTSVLVNLDDNKRLTSKSTVWSFYLNEQWLENMGVVAFFPPRDPNEPGYEQTIDLPQSAYLRSGGKIKIQNTKVSYIAYSWFNVYPTGVIKSLTVEGSFPYTVAGQTIRLKSEHKCFMKKSIRFNALSFAPEGHVREAVIAKSMSLRVNGKLRKAYEDDVITIGLDPGGHLEVEEIKSRSEFCQ